MSCSRKEGQQGGNMNGKQEQIFFCERTWFGERRKKIIECDLILVYSKEFGTCMS